MDGILEISGRIIIFTSNHPELIDEALLRPGRIDSIIEFTNLTKNDVNNMYHLWFDKYIDDNIFINMKDNIYSQANLGKLFSLGDLSLIDKYLSDNIIYD